MSHLLRPLFPLLLLLLVLVACQASPSDKSPDAVLPATSSEASQAADTLPYRVYEHFDELAPLLHQQNDTTYVVNFWATWCKPCVEELPYFEQLAGDIQDKPVKILMVSLDFKRDIPTKLLNFVHSRPFVLPLVALADTRYNDWIGKVDANWGGAIPITLVYHGDKRRFVEGQFASYQELKELVEEISL